MKVVVGISGASGSIYGLRLLERLRATGAVETHAILTRAGERTLLLETGQRATAVKELADHYYPVEDISGPLASGSVKRTVFSRAKFTSPLSCPRWEKAWPLTLK